MDKQAEVIFRCSDCERFLLQTKFEAKKIQIIKPEVAKRTLHYPVIINTTTVFLKSDCWRCGKFTNVTTGRHWTFPLSLYDSDFFNHNNFYFFTFHSLTSPSCTTQTQTDEDINNYKLMQHLIVSTVCDNTVHSRQTLLFPSGCAFNAL